jgi:uncharacterized membrane protein
MGIHSKNSRRKPTAGLDNLEWVPILIGEAVKDISSLFRSRGQKIVWCVVLVLMITQYFGVGNYNDSFNCTYRGHCHSLFSYLFFDILVAVVATLLIGSMKSKPKVINETEAPRVEATTINRRRQWKTILFPKLNWKHVVAFLLMSAVGTTLLNGSGWGIVVPFLIIWVLAATESFKKNA